MDNLIINLHLISIILRDKKNLSGINLFLYTIFLFLSKLRTQFCRQHIHIPVINQWKPVPKGFLFLPGCVKLAHPQHYTLFWPVESLWPYSRYPPSSLWLAPAFLPCNPTATAVSNGRDGHRHSLNLVNSCLLLSHACFVQFWDGY